jgi:hypothetical protein
MERGSQSEEVNVTGSQRRGSPKVAEDGHGCCCPNALRI